MAGLPEVFSVQEMFLELFCPGLFAVGNLLRFEKSLKICSELICPEIG